MQNIYCIGLTKTGTTSLLKALKILGVDDKHCGDHMAKVDIKRLYDADPDGKFILTERKSANVWYDSLCRYSLRPDKQNAQIYDIRKRIYGHSMPQEHESEFKSKYLVRNKHIKDFFEDKKHQFLNMCFENGDGWNELCEFLGLSIPEIPFPNLNKTKC